MEALNNHELEGVQIEVSLAKPQMDKNKRDSFMRGRGRGAQMGWQGYEDYFFNVLRYAAMISFAIFRWHLKLYIIQKLTLEMHVFRCLCWAANDRDIWILIA